MYTVYTYTIQTSTYSFGLYSSNMSSSLFRGKITHNHYLHWRFSRKSHFVLISVYNMFYWHGATHVVWSRIETFVNINPRDINSIVYMLCSKDFYEGQPRRLLLVKFIFSLPIFPQETFLRLGMSTQFIYSIVIGVLVLYCSSKDKFS